MSFDRAAIGILDIGLGNLRSVANAVYEVGYDYHLVSTPEAFAEISHLIIPGVGHFSYAMKAIEVSGLKQSIDNYVRVSRAPVLGICLGFQLLAEFSEEGNLAGLGYIPGKVRRLNKALLPVPHTGWNSVEQKSTHPLFKGIKNGRDFYFVHSYEMRVNQPEQILAATDYGGEVICGVGFENIVGVQFHPEKSQKNGLQLLENFCRWDGT